MADGKPSGQGVYSWVDGTTYEGAFLFGLKHGRGFGRWGGAFISQIELIKQF